MRRGRRSRSRGGSRPGSAAGKSSTPRTLFILDGNIIPQHLAVRLALFYTLKKHAQRLRHAGVVGVQALPPLGKPHKATEYTDEGTDKV